MEAQFRDIPDALWEQVAPRIPGPRKNTLRGRPPVPDPTDRAKSGVKRHILTDGRGVPLAAEITGANFHDKWLVAQTTVCSR